MKHSRARNVIERWFGMLKLRWGIIRDTTWYPIKTKCKIISTCALLHNFIKSNMKIDPIEARVGENGENEDALNEDFVLHLESSTARNNFRHQLTNEMFNDWQNSRHL